MKKLLALILSAVLMLSLCCCGGAGGSTGGSAGGYEGKADDPKPTGNPYVGVWYHAKTDDEPFQMALRIFEDGSADSGKKSDTYTMSWKESDNGIIVVTEYKDYLPNEEPAYLLEDGTLKWETTFKLASNEKEYTYVIFEKQ